MSNIEQGAEFSPNKPIPAREVNLALQAVEFGQMPHFTQEELLTSLHLDGDEPDGAALMERFTGGVFSFSTFREIPLLMAGTNALFEKANENRTNESEEALAHMIGQVIVKQVDREGDICPGARNIALSVKRDDIIPSDLRAKLAGEGEAAISHKEKEEVYEEEEIDLGELQMLIQLLMGVGDNTQNHVDKEGNFVPGGIQVELILGDGEQHILFDRQQDQDSSSSSISDNQNTQQP